MLTFFKNHKILTALIIIVVVLLLLSIRHIPDKSEIKYGVSFSKFHADELKLDWKEVLMAILDDLGVHRFRFSAHWPMTEPEQGKYNFSEIDFQVKEAAKRNAEIILAVGRRLPGWPECHEPEWVKELSQNEKQEAILKYIETTINRYKNNPAIKMWQVENEPFLTFFGRSHCGDLDEEFLDKEISLVKNLDPTRQVMVTDSGEFGKWFGAYSHGDAFGTSLYLYVWWRNPIIGGPIRYPITPAFFRVKQNIVSFIKGSRPSIIIELSSEPWLLQPIVNTPLDVQLDRMGIDKFNEMIDFSSKTGFDTMYLWGAEWWYWLKKQEHTDGHWDRARELFNSHDSP